jgi:hypothetical protein
LFQRIQRWRSEQPLALQFVQGAVAGPRGNQAAAVDAQ